MSQPTPQEIVDLWNEKCPVGQPVVRYKIINPLEDGKLTFTSTKAWLAATGEPVVKVHGIEGYVLLESVIRISGKVHELKTWPQYFAAVEVGAKTFEVRENDRGYAVGDVLVLREWDPRTELYTDRRVVCRVTYMLDGSKSHHGVRSSYCVMAISLLANEIPIFDGDRIVAKL